MDALSLLSQRVKYGGDVYVVKTLRVVGTGIRKSTRIYLAHTDRDRRGVRVNMPLQTFLRRYKLCSD